VVSVLLSHTDLPSEAQTVWAQHARGAAAAALGPVLLLLAPTWQQQPPLVPGAGRHMAPCGVLAGDTSLCTAARMCAFMVACRGKISSLQVLEECSRCHMPCVQCTHQGLQAVQLRGTMQSDSVLGKGSDQ